MLNQVVGQAALLEGKTRQTQGKEGLESARGTEDDGEPSMEYI